MRIPSRMAAAGVRARCFALGVRSEAVSAISALERGEPAQGLTETYTLADYSWCEGSGVARAAGGRGGCFALEMGGLEPPTPCLQSRCSPS